MPPTLLFKNNIKTTTWQPHYIHVNIICFLHAPHQMVRPWPFSPRNCQLTQFSVLQASSAIVAGIGLATIGFAGRYVLRQMPNAATKMQEAFKNLPKFDANSKYYRGGFDPKMNKREAALILGVSPTATKLKVVYY